MSTFTSSLINESRFQVRNHWDGELLGSFPDRVTADYVQYLANYQSFRGSRLDGKPLVLLPREKSPVYDVVDQLEAED